MAQIPRESASQHKAVIKPFLDGHSPTQCTQQLPDAGVVSGWGHCDVLHVKVLAHQPCCPTRGLPMKSFPPIVKGHQPISGNSMYKTVGTQTRRRLGPQFPRSFPLTTEALVHTHARPPGLTACPLAAPGLTLGPHSTARPSHHTGSAAGTPCRHQPRSRRGARQRGHCPLEPEGPPPAPSSRATPLAF